MLPYRWVILWNNQPVGLDSDSGGYPYKTDYPGNVKYWATQKEAQDYVDIMTMKGSSSTYSVSSFRIVEIQFRIVG